MYKCGHIHCEYNDGCGCCTRETEEIDGELYEFEQWNCEDYEEPEPEHVFDEWDWADMQREDYYND